MNEELNVNGVPHGLLDGMDDLPDLPAGYVASLLESAPDYVKARAAEVAKARVAAPAPAEA